MSCLHEFPAWNMAVTRFALVSAAANSHMGTFDIDCVEDEFEGAGSLVSCNFPQHYVVYVCWRGGQIKEALSGGQEGAQLK